MEKEFKKKCSLIFNCLRKHANIFITMLTVLSDESGGGGGEYVKERIIETITKRFEPGEGEFLNSETYIETIIENSHDTLTTNMFDFLYRFTKSFK